MMKKSLFILGVLFLMATISFAKDYTRWNLPEGAKVRFGKGTINAMKYSPDGAQLIVGSSIGIWVYDTHIYQERSLSRSDTDPIEALAFSENGETLFGTDSYGAIQQWDMTSTDSHPRTLQSEERRVYGERFVKVAFSPDGTMLASGGQEGAIQLWDVHTHTHLLSFEGDTGAGEVSALAFAPDGKTLASSSGFEDKTIQLWALPSLLEETFSEGFIDRDPGDSGTSLRKAKVVPRLTLIGGNGAFALAFAPDGRTLASGDFGGSITFWDVETGRELHTFRGQTDAIRALAFSPDGETLASGSWDGTIRMWATDTGRERAVITEHAPFVQEVALTPDNNTLASVNRNVNIRLWDANTGHVQSIFGGKGGLIRFLEFAEDGSTFACADVGITFWVSDVATGREQFTYTLEGHTKSIWKTALSPDRRILASGSYDTTIRLWDIFTGEPIFVLSGHKNGVGALAFSPDGSMLASGSRDETIRLWDTATGTERFTLTGHIGEVESVDFSPDNSTLGSGSWDGTVRLWDISSLNKKMDTLPAKKRESHSTILGRHGGGVLSVVFSPDGKTLVSADTGGSILLWNTDTNPQVPTQSWLRGNFTAESLAISTLQGHTSWIRNLEFSVDGSTLISGSSDGTVLLWNWEEIIHLENR